MPEDVRTLGDLAILERELLAFFCSRQCPGSVIIKAYDLAVALRDAGVPVIGGFHAPMEQEVLTILLRGSQPVVWCPARDIPQRLPADRRAAIAEGRLLIVSPFAARRPTDRMAWQRNHYVQRLAAASLVAHAAPGGKTEELVTDWLGLGSTLLTLDDPANDNLVGCGALPVGNRRATWPDDLLLLTRPAADDTGQLPLFSQK